MFPLFPLTYLWNQVKSVRGKHEEVYKNIKMMCLCWLLLLRVRSSVAVCAGGSAARSLTKKLQK